MSLQYREYDVALSFAGEDRIHAETLAKLLKSANVKVFYDSFEESSLWGEDIYTYLADIYGKKAKYCIMFLSKNYASKLWTNHERKFAQERAFKENRSYILPIKLDDTEIPGIPSTIGYLDLRKKTIEHVVELLLEKLQAFKGKGIDQAEGKEPVKMISEENKHDNAQQLLKVIETENKEGDNMDPARRFTYNFLSLPYDMRLDIAQQLHLIQAEDEGVHGIELFKRFFRRAREKQVLEQLKIIVNKRFEETKELLH